MKVLVFILPLLVFASCNFRSSDYYNSEAQKLEEEGNYKEAITLLDKAVELDPQNTYALINRAVDKSLLGDFQGAIADYSKIIEYDSTNTLAYFNRGKNRKRIDDFEGAIHDFDKAISTKGDELIYLDPVENSSIDNGFEFDVDMEEIRYERGIARYHIDSFGSALEDFDFCVSQNFEVPACSYWIGLVHIADHRRGEACAAFTTSAKLGYHEATKMLEKYCGK